MLDDRAANNGGLAQGKQGCPRWLSTLVVVTTARLTACVGTSACVAQRGMHRKSSARRRSRTVQTQRRGPADVREAIRARHPSACGIEKQPVRIY